MEDKYCEDHSGGTGRLYLITGDGEVLGSHQGGQDGVSHGDAGGQLQHADYYDAHQAERDNHSQWGDVEMLR